MNRDKNRIAFDQFQRYETIARLILYHHKKLGAKKFSILELGSNEHKDLKLFLPDDEILFTDVVLSDVMKSDPDFQWADGTALQFEDKSFDFVVAADVFEHVPEHKRKNFLLEAYRVAQKGVILCFPQNTQDVADAENRVNTYYKTIAGEDFVWLKEHSLCGLPNANEINSTLEENGIPYFQLQHGDITTWEKMWYCHLTTVFTPETLEYQTDIDNYYNTKLYRNDVSDSNYRVFYVLSSATKDWQEYAQDIWGTVDQEHVQFLNTLFQIHTNLHPLHEQGRLQQIIFDKERHIQNQDAMLVKREVQLAELENVCKQTQKHLDGLKKEHVEELEHLQGVIEEYKTSIDELEQNYQEAEKKLSYYTEHYHAAMNQREELRTELAHYTEHYFAAIQQREELKVQIVQVQAMYDSISNATFWKITKPMRVILDGIKGALKRNRVTYLCCKGLKCFKENGFRYTWRKVREKLNHRKDYLALAGRALFTEEELEAQRKHKFSKDVKFSIVVPLYNTPSEFLHEMIRSVLDQTYGNWELCMADGSDSEHGEVAQICRSYVRKDSRVKYRKLEKNLGISGNTNACLEIASGDYIGLFDHDDLLHPAALFEVMKAICEQGADFIYTDENTFHDTPADAFCPHFKPDYAPDTLRSYNYICHFTVFKKTLTEQIGMFRKSFDGSQDYDMVLRLTEQAEHIVHIPKILYYWRAHKNSVAENIGAKPYTLDAARRALAEHLERIGLQGAVEDSAIPSTYKINYVIAGNPKVSIVIPNMDYADTLRTCVNSIFEKTTYPNYEIVIVENNSKQKETFDYYEQLKENDKVKIVTWSDKFNYSAINNYGIREAASGEYVLLLNNDIEVITPDWIQEMLMFAQRKDVGAVGAMLYYPDDTIQHAGVILGIGGVAGHSHKYFQRGSHGYMSRATIAQDLSAVTAACMLIRRDVWDEVEGLDEQYQVAFNDVDLCMRIRKAGYLIVWTPYAELYHYESKSRGYEDTPEKQKRFEGEVLRFQKRWRKELDAGDPYYNPNFTLEREDFSLK